MKFHASKMASALGTLLLAMVLVGSTLAVPAMDEVKDPFALADEHVRQSGAVQGHHDLLGIAGPELTERIESGQTDGFDVILLGPAHVGVTEARFPQRGQAMEELERRSEPFFGLVEGVTTILGGDVVKSWPAANAVKVSGDLTLLQTLAAIDGVRHMALDYVGVVGLEQDPGVDPIPDEAGAQNSEGRKMIQAEDIWAAGFEGDGITVAVIDTGIDADHEAFKNTDGTSRVEKFADCVTDGCDEVSPYDDHGHGTHVAGTAAGSDAYDDPEHGTFEEVGVAPKADIFGVKFLNSGGGGSFEGAMDALQWSFDNDADLTSNSWGGGCSASSSVITLLNQLNDLGMVSVTSAGNAGPSSNTISGPACAISAIAVGAVDGDENIASFSSRGSCTDPTEEEGDRTCPHVVAKGVAVRSAIPRSGATNADPSGYKTWQGTSMSGPHVAGAVILMEEMKRFYDGVGWDTANRAEQEMLKLTAKGLPEGGETPNNDYGWGIAQLLPVLALLEDSDDANIIDSFSISKEEVRLSESTTLSFSVTNLGGATANGEFLAELEHPDGTLETLADETVSLGLLDGASVSETVTVQGDVLPGEYTFSASFDYTWEDGDGEEQSGLVEHVGTFVVKRVFLEMDLEGLENETSPANRQDLAFQVDSTGNEPAFDMTLEFTFADSYEFIPGANFDPLDLNTVYADPAPDRVVENSDHNRITLIWDVGDLPEGDSFSFTSSVLPTLPGDYNFLGVGKFDDGIGQSFGQAKVWNQTVDLGL